MAVTMSKVFNFIQGTDITGESTYDIWKELNPEGTKEEFLNFIISGPTSLDEMNITDTNGVLGEENKEVNAQSLIDSITQKISDLEEIAELIETI